LSQDGETCHEQMSEASVPRFECGRRETLSGDGQRLGLRMHVVGAKSERDVGMAKPCRDQRDGYALKVHERGARVPRIVKADQGYIEVFDRGLPQPAQCRGVVGLPGLVADRVAEVRYASPSASFSVACRPLAAFSSINRASGMGSTRPADAVLGSS
jgi:hypothetical protein